MSLSRLLITDLPSAAPRAGEVVVWVGRSEPPARCRTSRAGRPSAHGGGGRRLCARTLTGPAPTSASITGATAHQADVALTTGLRGVTRLDMHQHVWPDAFRRQLERRRRPPSLRRREPDASPRWRLRGRRCDLLVPRPAWSSSTATASTRRSCTSPPTTEPTPDLVELWTPRSRSPSSVSPARGSFRSPTRSRDQASSERSSARPRSSTSTAPRLSSPRSTGRAVRVRAPRCHPTVRTCVADTRHHLPRADAEGVRRLARRGHPPLAAAPRRLRAPRRWSGVPARAPRSAGLPLATPSRDRRLERPRTELLDLSRGRSSRGHVFGSDAPSTAFAARVRPPADSETRSSVAPQLEPLALLTASAGRGRHRALLPSAGRDLTVGELERVVAELAARPHAVAPPGTLILQPPPLRSAPPDPHLDARLICWDAEQETGLHDHDLSTGAGYVVEGTLLEDSLRPSGTSLFLRTTQHRTGRRPRLRREPHPRRPPEAVRPRPGSTPTRPRLAMGISPSVKRARPRSVRGHGRALRGRGSALSCLRPRAPAPARLTPSRADGAGSTLGVTHSSSVRRWNALRLAFKRDRRHEAPARLRRSGSCRRRTSG